MKPIITTFTVVLSETPHPTEDRIDTDVQCFANSLTPFTEEAQEVYSRLTKALDSIADEAGEDGEEYELCEQDLTDGSVKPVE